MTRVTRRFGFESGANPLACGVRCPTSTSTPGVRPWAVTAFLNPASTQPWVTPVLPAATLLSSVMPVALSWTDPATTITAMSSPARQ